MQQLQANNKSWTFCRDLSPIKTENPPLNTTHPMLHSGTIPLQSLGRADIPLTSANR
jgi:hypothetical protein